MSQYLPVPVSAAKEIADRYQKSMVILLSFDPVFELTHTTTYGRSAVEKQFSAELGDLVTRAVGGDLSQKRPFEDFRTRSAAEAAEQIDRRNELLGRIREFSMRLPPDLVTAIEAELAPKP